jgi:hypothetical protein
MLPNDCVTLTVDVILFISSHYIAVIDLNHFKINSKYIQL